MVTFPEPAIVADAVPEDGIVTIAVSFDAYVLETVPALEEMLLLESKETVAPETNFR